MRLLFDARYIRWEFHDGISRYSAELAAAVAAEAPARGVQVVFLVFDDRQVPLLPAGATVLKIHAPTAWQEPFSALILNRFRPDVLFSPMQTIGSAGRRFGLILTLHDMIYYRHRTPPRDLPWYVRIGWRLFHLSYVPQRVTLNAADAVATVSDTSAAQFAEVRLTKRPVVVIPNAPQQLAAYGVDVVPGARNLVYMGSFMPYKNVETLVRAMRLLPGRTLHLLSRISPERRAELAALAGDGDVVFHGGVTDAEYAAALADRAVLVTTSRDEGYGLPVAEALALGVPAVVTDMPIFREVAGAGALYVDPDSPESVADAVRSLDDPARLAEVVAAGTAHISRFTWTRSAGILLDTVTSLAR
ncbi:glycosyltransferase family 4 protein [Microbacterium telephonicum]|uniref:Glycosyltransferase involved in cell wall biosynthesis n=1 Tax=Microbacterium telephonicum TaxID=1714841 RepID=A0A498BSV8_9MICO|nr:glycosyltransferase family 1 protein [Microbacterium telephonicum]RLK46602.1 glycosyltransferase involved in cell wall biosynthesis [Microbacterium telephonicum]